MKQYVCDAKSTAKRPCAAFGRAPQALRPRAGTARMRKSSPRAAFARLRGARPAYRALCGAVLAAALLAACGASPPSAAPGGASGAPPAWSGPAGPGAQAPAASGAETAARALSPEEQDALWEQLAGRWILTDEAKWREGADGFAYQVYEFSRTETGGCMLQAYSAGGSGSERWEFDAALAKDGAYTLEAARENSDGMSVRTCQPGSGTRFALRLEGERLTLSWARPTRVWWEEEPAQEPPSRQFTRPATEEEQARLPEGEDASVWLDEAHTGGVVRGYEAEPSVWRKTDEEELKRLMGAAFGG